MACAYAHPTGQDMLIYLYSNNSSISTEMTANITVFIEDNQFLCSSFAVKKTEHEFMAKLRSCSGAVDDILLILFLDFILYSLFFFC